jgi:hypothetical protein
MEIEDKKNNKKHIGEERPLPSDSTLKPSSNPKNPNSNGNNNNPLKPEETQKDIEGKK